MMMMMMMMIERFARATKSETLDGTQIGNLYIETSAFDWPPLEARAQRKEVCFIAWQAPVIKGTS